MEIVPFEAGHVAGVTRLVNAQIASVPPYWQLSEDAVWDILQKESLWEIHYEDDEPSPWTWHTETLCVVEDARMLAAGRFTYRYDEGRLGLIFGRWLVGEADQAVGMLVDRLLAKQSGDAVEVMVNGRSDFGVGWSGVPITDAVVMGVLAAKGFVPFQKWVIMTAEIEAEIEPHRRRESTEGTEPTPQSSHASVQPHPPPPSPYTERGSQAMRWRVDGGRLEWDVQIYDGEVMIGECQSWGIPPEFNGCAGYEEWIEIEWLGVEEAYQRRGLGRRLLGAQLQYHAGRGVKHCLLYTEVTNVAARAVNVSLGFEVKAEVWGWTWKAES